MAGSVIRDLGTPSRFRMRWPRVDITNWPGRQAFWAWRHPILIPLGVIAVANIISGTLGGPSFDGGR